MSIDLRKELKGAESIAITGHIRPDGDCIGSVMGMYMLVKKLCPVAKVIPLLEKPAAEFNIIRDIEDICSDFEPGIEQFDIFIGLDCSLPERYGEAERFYLNAGKRIIIDHHVSNEGFGDVCLVRPDASSTAEIVYSLIDPELMDEELAKAIYIGIIHDTGVLQYSCTSPDTLRAVAKLIEYGFDFPAIIEETFYEKTKIQNEILGRALLESMLFMDGKCIVSKIDRRLMEFYGATPHDFEGIVNQLKVTKGVEVAIFMYELEPLCYKVSLRSRGVVDVAKIAKFFGGGGHVRAAGFTMNGTYHDVINNISDAIAIQLDRKNEWNN